MEAIAWESLHAHHATQVRPREIGWVTGGLGFPVDGRFFPGWCIDRAGVEGQHLVLHPIILAQPDMLAELRFNRGPGLGVIEPARITRDAGPYIGTPGRVGAEIAVVVFHLEQGVQRPEGEVILVGVDELIPVLGAEGQCRSSALPRHPAAAGRLGYEEALVGNVLLHRFVPALSDGQHPLQRHVEPAFPGVFLKKVILIRVIAARNGIRVEGIAIHVDAALTLATGQERRVDEEALCSDHVDVACTKCQHGRVVGRIIEGPEHRCRFPQPFRGHAEQAEREAE